MNEINFFKPYIDANTKKISVKEIIPYILISLLIIAFVGLHLTLLDKRNKKEMALEEANNEINQLIESSEYADVIQLKEESEFYQSNIDLLDEIINSMDPIQRIDKKMISYLVDETPVNTFIASISYNDNLINLSCISSSYSSAAQYIYNIKSLDYFDNVFLEEINEDTGEYYYSIEVGLGGETDEN